MSLADEVVATYLKGLNLPCGRSQVVAWARQQGAEPRIVEWLGQLPRESFGSLDAIHGYLSQLPPPEAEETGPRIRSEEEIAGTAP